MFVKVTLALYAKQCAISVTCNVFNIDPAHLARPQAIQEHQCDDEFVALAHDTLRGDALQELLRLKCRERVLVVFARTDA